MAEEFIINSNAIETKINSLLPSQGGFAPGVDFSASTMVIPIVDLTETAEGGTTRQDLQTALSLGSITSFDVSNATTTLINTTGYFRVFGNVQNFSGSNTAANFKLTDGTTTKIIIAFDHNSGSLITTSEIDFIVFLTAGVSLIAESGASNISITGCTRQIADLSGNLVNPI